ncbi:MAG: ribonuclease J [Myxococcales bacterium]|nr:MAG: ribonuclease J [Myxococcales bacterium]
MDEAIRLMPLGGLGEVGMNCLMIEHDGQIVLIDCGITFYDDDNGVDVIHPDFSYLESTDSTLVGVVITHGHEDHIGALPYLLKKFHVPIMAPAYAAELIEKRLSEHRFSKAPDLRRIKPHDEYELGPFRFTHLPVTHSINGATALAIETAVGTVIHSGDFKIDPTPTDGVHFDAESLKKLGDEGVRLLLSDSTNIDTSGVAGSELTVRKALERHIRKAEGAVAVAIFASNTYRLSSLVDIAKRSGRKLYPLGRSVQNHLSIARSLGLIQHLDDVLVDEKSSQDVPRKQLLMVATGTQGETGSALNRIAYDEHAQATLGPGDLLLMSSRIIPGREKSVFSMLDALERRGVRVLSRKDDPEIHVSGHACQQEQRRMIQFTRPQSFIPVHGTFHHLNRHAALATDLGIRDTLVIENGDVVELSAEGMEIVEQNHTGRVYIQANRPLSPLALKDRVLLGRLGVAVVSFVVDFEEAWLGEVQVFLRGIVNTDDNESLIDDAEDHVRKAVETALAKNKNTDTERLSELAKQALRSFLRKKTGQRPLCYAMVLEAG